jgi:hypothetical protein
MKYIVLLLTVICFSSCGRENTGFHGNLIEIDHKSLPKFNLSDFVDDMDIIRLETNENCIIGNISTVRLFQDRVYILDELSNTFFVYDTSGRFIDKLYKVGSGPDEYIQLKDFEVNNSGIYLLDLSGHKINRYDFDLKYLSNIKVQSVCSNFIAVNNDFWLYNEPSLMPNDYQLTRIDETGKILDSYFSRSKDVKNFAVSSNVFQKNNDTLYFSPRYSNTVYMKTENGWIEHSKLSFREKSFPDTKDISSQDVLQDNFPYILRRNFYISDKFIITDFIIEQERFFSFYDKHIHNGKAGRIENNLIPDYDRFFPRWLNTNFLIECIESENILTDFKGLLTADESLSDLRPDDNPVLILYQLKR